jgi:hypothetical protein
VVADVAGFPERLVDHWVKRDGASNELAALGSTSLDPLPAGDTYPLAI